MPKSSVAIANGSSAVATSAIADRCDSYPASFAAWSVGGFFLSPAGKARTTPNALIWLLYAGAVSLGLGVASLGIGLLTTAI